MKSEQIPTNNFGLYTKKLFSISYIIGSNTLVGAISGFCRFKQDKAENHIVGIINAFFIPIYGGLLGFINGLKFEAVSVITDYFQPEDSTITKVGVNLGINLAVSSLGYTLTANNIVLGGGLFATLCVMDVINYGIESYIDNQDCIEVTNIG